MCFRSVAVAGESLRSAHRDVACLVETPITVPQPRALRTRRRVQFAEDGLSEVKRGALEAPGRIIVSIVAKRENGNGRTRLLNVRSPSSTCSVPPATRSRCKNVVALVDVHEGEEQTTRCAASIRRSKLVRCLVCSSLLFIPISATVHPKMPFCAVSTPRATVVFSDSAQSLPPVKEIKLSLMPMLFSRYYIRIVLTHASS